MTMPALHMGLIGFADEAMPRALLEDRAGPFCWQATPPQQADALWVYGECARPAPGGRVVVPSPDPRQPATLLHLQEVEVPLAFTLPLPTPGVHPPQVFDPRSPASVDHCLHRFETWLLPLAAELAVAAGIAERRHSLHSHVYHLMEQGSLVGIVDLDGDVGLAPRVGPRDVLAAEWCGRPDSAHHMPAHFSRTSIAQVMWWHVVRTGDALLPERYRSGLIHFRGAPSVPRQLLQPLHTLVLGQLTSAPATLAQLCRQTGHGEHEIAVVLSALYFAGSITTHARKPAWVPRTQGLRRGLAEGGFPSSNFETRPLHEAAASHPPTGMTPLEAMIRR